MTGIPPDERAVRLAGAAAHCGADWTILTSADAVCYATGHEISIETGPSPFKGGPTVAVVSADGISALLVDELERVQAEASSASLVRSYESLGWQDSRPLEERFAHLAQTLARELGLGGQVAVQTASFPAALRDVLEPIVSGFVSIDRPLQLARARKTGMELERLARCAELTAVGQRAALEVVRAGRTELEVFADIRGAMESDAGARLPVSGDLISGPDRTAAVMGWPGNRAVETGDPVICDLAPRLGGYWGDSCNTLVVGEPSSALKRLHEGASRALAHAAETLRPGIRACDFDAGVRGVLEKEKLHNPVHIGHGVGTSVHEWPRLTPGSNALLEEDMVLMVEPGAYEPGVGGVRLEWMFRVTAAGAEVMSPFTHELSA